MKSITHIAVPEDDAELLVMRLQKATGVAFNAHDSSYKGEYWQHKSLNGDVAEVSYNDDPMWRDGDPEEEQFFQPEFSEFAVLVWVSGTAEFVSTVASSVTALCSGSVIIESTAAQQGIQADAASPRRLT
ncbi:hypothetical protein [Nevskia ramosa]|uniref:hypothetical protein n=1 Tax=Nevskia ramosa TaxID=64002 RepID=UPI002355E7F6|nr:hypothetical protein [Nevskia ramosa]